MGLERMLPNLAALSLRTGGNANDALNLREAFYPWWCEWESGVGVPINVTLYYLVKDALTGDNVIELRSFQRTMKLNHLEKYLPFRDEDVHSEDVTLPGIDKKFTVRTQFQVMPCDSPRGQQIARVASGLQLPLNDRVKIPVSTVPLNLEQRLEELTDQKFVSYEATQHQPAILPFVATLKQHYIFYKVTAPNNPKEKPRFGMHVVEPVFSDPEQRQSNKDLLQEYLRETTEGKWLRDYHRELTPVKNGENDDISHAGFKVGYEKRLKFKAETDAAFDDAFEAEFKEFEAEFEEFEAGGDAPAATADEQTTSKRKHAHP